MVVLESPFGPCGPGSPFEPMAMQPLNAVINITSVNSLRFFMDSPIFVNNTCEVDKIYRFKAGSMQYTTGTHFFLDAEVYSTVIR